MDRDEGGLRRGLGLFDATMVVVGSMIGSGIFLLTWTNTRGLEYGRLVQNVFTTTKGAALLALAAVRLLVGWNTLAVESNA